MIHIQICDFFILLLKGLEEIVIVRLRFVLQEAQPTHVEVGAGRNPSCLLWLRPERASSMAQITKQVEVGAGTRPRVAPSPSLNQQPLLQEKRPVRFWLSYSRQAC